MQGKTRIALGMALLFLSGVAVGFFGSGFLLRQRVQEFVGRGPAVMPGRLARRALRDIELRPEQRERIDKILSETEPGLRRIAMEFGAAMQQATNEQAERIGEVLDDDQRTEFERSLAEMRRRFEKMREDRRRRGPGHPRGAPPSPDQLRRGH